MASDHARRLHDALPPPLPPAEGEHALEHAVLGIALGADETLYAQFGGASGHPLYFSLLNLPNAILSSQIAHALSALAMFPDVRRRDVSLIAQLLEQIAARYRTFAAEEPSPEELTFCKHEVYHAVRELQRPC
jgi:hypothetical protein